jgi:hypothetical protein
MIFVPWTSPIVGVHADCVATRIKDTEPFGKRSLNRHDQVMHRQFHTSKYSLGRGLHLPRCVHSRQELKKKFSRFDCEI